MIKLVPAFIALGSNVGDSIGHLHWAARRLNETRSSRICAYSPIYMSEPVGLTDQPEFTNAVLKIETSLSAQELLQQIRLIEAERGRDRTGPRWGPRTLDIDILLYDDRIITDRDLIIPHPRMTQRNFVLTPLRDLEGDDFKVPGYGTIRDLSASCPAGRLTRAGTF